MPNCTIVVPCYNEAERLRAEEFTKYLEQRPHVAFLFVNDGSKDGTLAMLQQLALRMPKQIDVLNRSVNSGKAEAVRAGLVAALETGRPAYVGFWDADLATPLEAIDDMLGLLLSRPDLEIVLGARVKLLGRHIERLAVRHYLGRVFATCVSIVLGLPIYDTQCGAKLFRVTPVLESILEEPFSSRWIFDVELLARFIRASGPDPASAAHKIYEFPLYRWRDVPGSKVRPSDFVIAFKELLKIGTKYRSKSLRPARATEEGASSKQTRRV